MNSVDHLRFEWHDPKRDRKIPVKVYYPRLGAGPFPVILFSHGLGGSREDYGYLGRHWAENGYVCFHLQHLGSDLAIWQNAPPGEVMQAMRLAASKPENTSNRIQDVVFAMDQLPWLDSEEGPLHFRLDLHNIGLSGHSFGALTTMAIAGQVFTTPEGHRITAPDLRVKAALAMSSPLPRNKEHWGTAYARMRIPCLHMTGTEDEIAIGQSPPSDRRVPFDQTQGAEAWLITIRSADHMVFVGLKRNATRADIDSGIHNLIKRCSLVYWDALLKGSPAAAEQFKIENMSRLIAGEAVFETKTRV